MISIPKCLQDDADAGIGELEEQEVWWMKRRILKAISLICTCVMLLTLAACGEESQDNTGKYIVFKFGNDNIYLDEVYIYAQTTIDEYENGTDEDDAEEAETESEGAEEE